MKNIFLIAVLFISAYSFAQSSVNGKITDLESDNAPLMFAHVTIKETGAKTTADEKGLYKFENLEKGDYTLVYSFVGYESKEVKINMMSEQQNNINMALGASTVSLDDLMLVMASADNKTEHKESSN